MVKGTNPKDPSLKQIMDRTWLASREIKITFFHILRGNNSEADKMANVAIGKNLGTLSIDEFQSQPPCINELPREKKGQSKEPLPMGFK
jgi:hypothetical protein